MTKLQAIIQIGHALVCMRAAGRAPLLEDVTEETDRALLLIKAPMKFRDATIQGVINRLGKAPQ